MKISLIPDDGVMAVDGEGYKIDCHDCDPHIHAIVFDTDEQQGIIEYKRTVMQLVAVRDHGAEGIEIARMRQAHKDLSNLPPRFKQVQIRRGSERITSFAEFQKFYARWQEAKHGASQSK